MNAEKQHYLEYLNTIQSFVSHPGYDVMDARLADLENKVFAELQVGLEPAVITRLAGQLRTLRDVRTWAAREIATTKHIVDGLED